MARYIDGDDFQKRIEQLCDVLCEYSKKQRQFMCSACKLGNVLDVIDDAPTVDAVPVRYGHWRHYEGMLLCSECGMEFYDDIMEYCGDNVPHFCPECGADMRKDGEQA